MQTEQQSQEPGVYEEPQLVEYGQIAEKTLGVTFSEVPA